mmetsp:Transcript_1008/g.662  ORF Transcript_1008/g.662 Transcript_1008/m.662 type:complete len:134 (+) Transcript_1008:581-982(+)
MNLLVDSLVSLNTIRCLDVSKNKFHPETVSHLLRRLPSLSNLEVLHISQIGIDEDSAESLIYMLNEMKKLRVLNLAGNQLPIEVITQAFGILKRSMCLEDLDISKMPFDNSIECMTELGQIISRVITLKSLSV